MGHGSCLFSIPWIADEDARKFPREDAGLKYGLAEYKTITASVAHYWLSFAYLEVTDTIKKNPCLRYGYSIHF